MAKGRLLSLLLALALALTAVPLGTAAFSGAEMGQDEELTGEFQELGITFTQGEDGAYLMEDTLGIVLPVEQMQEVTVSDDGEFLTEDAQGNSMTLAEYRARYADGEPMAESAAKGTWAEFAQRLNKQMATYKGELIIREEHVPAYTMGKRHAAADMPLNVPDGVQLIFENCRFDGLLVSTGDITLRACTAGTGQAVASILIMESPGTGKATHLRLTIDKDTLVTANSASAIEDVPAYNKSSKIEIYNYGTIESQEDAISFQRQGEWNRNTNSEVFIYNYGVIRGAQDLYMYTHGGTMALYVENSGLMEGDARPVRLRMQGYRQKGKATFWNREGGIVRATGADPEIGFNEAVEMYLYEGSDDSAMLTGEIINEGLIQGDDCALYLNTRLTNPRPITLKGDGEYKTLREDAPMMRIRVSQIESTEEEWMQTPVQVEEALAEWLEHLGFYALPATTRATVQVYTAIWENRTANPKEYFVFDVSAKGQPRAPMTWAELLLQAEEALAAGQAETHCFVAQPVLAPEAMDLPLAVPPGRRLVLKGGSYEEIRLASGDYELGDLTVHATGEAQSALTVEGAGQPPLRLTIGEDVSIRQEGATGAALAINGKLGKDAVIDIANHGAIYSGHQEALRLALAVVGESSLTLRLSNTGSMTGRTAGAELDLEASKGALDLEVDNRGSLEAALGQALAVRGAAAKGSLRARLTNQAGAEMISQGTEGLLLALTGIATAGDPQGYGGLVYNEGLIRGKDAAVRLMPAAQRPVKIRLRGEGVLEAGGAAVAVAFLQQLARSADQPMAEADYAPLRDLWLKQMGMRYLPSDARVDSALLTRYAGKDGDVDAQWYERLDQGGGQRMPALAAEEANFDAPLYQRTAGDGAVETTELKLSTYPLQALAAFELRADDQELWLDIRGEMQQYTNWANLQKTKGPDIVPREGTRYSIEGLLASAYGDMLVRLKKTPVEGTLAGGRELQISDEKLNEGLRLMYPEAEFTITGGEEEGFRTGVDGQTFWTQTKTRNPAPYLAAAPAAEGDIPFPAYTVNGQGRYLRLSDALTLYALYAGVQNQQY